MTDVLWHSVAVALTLLFSVLQAIGQTAVVHWGTETWLCGDVSYYLTLGDGTKDVVIYQWDTTVTATPQNGTGNGAGNAQRQGLVVLFYNPVASMQAVTTSPPSGSNNEVDPSLWAINPKTIGLNPTVIAKNFGFYHNPLIAKNGWFQLRVTNGPNGAQFVGDCLDLEIHQTIVWGFASPDGL